MTQITPPPEYDNHEVGDWEESRSIWEQLSDFWDLMTNKGLVTVFWKAWDGVRVDMEEYLEHHQYDYSFRSDSYKGVVAPYLKEISFGDDNRIGSTHSYYVDEDIRSIISLKNFIQAPTLVYYDKEGSPDAGHTFSFTSDTLRGTSGVVTFHDSDYRTFAREWSDGNYRMWASFIYKSNEAVVEKFGPFVDYDQTDKLETDALNALNAMFYVHEMGPVIPNLETALYIYCDWPYAPQSGTVTDISGDALTITNDNGVEKVVVSPIVTNTFQHRDDSGAWLNIFVGDEVTIYEPLARIVEINDIVTDPNFWVKIGIGSKEKYHTFSLVLNGDTSDTTGSPYDLERILRLLDRLKPIGDKPHITSRIHGWVSGWELGSNTSYQPVELADGSLWDYSFGMGVCSLPLVPSAHSTYDDLDVGVLPIDCGMFGDPVDISSMRFYSYTTYDDIDITWQRMRAYGGGGMITTISLNVTAYSDWS